MCDYIGYRFFSIHVSCLVSHKLEEYRDVYGMTELSIGSFSDKVRHTFDLNFLEEFFNPDEGF